MQLVVSILPILALAFSSLAIPVAPTGQDFDLVQNLGIGAPIEARQDKTFNVELCLDKNRNNCDGGLNYIDNQCYNAGTNDQISSIFPEIGAECHFHVDADCQGPALTVWHPGINDLKDFAGFNDQITSFKYVQD